MSRDIKQIVQSMLLNCLPKRLCQFTFPHPFPHTFTSTAFPRFLILAASTLLTGNEKKKMKNKSWSSTVMIKGLECPFVIKEGRRWPKWHLGTCLIPKERNRARDVSSSQDCTGKRLTPDYMGGEPWFVVFANFNGVNTPTVANFRLSMWYH